MLWPLHWLRLLSSANDFTANPVLGSATLNKMGLHVLRKRAALAVCQWRRMGRRMELPDGLAEQLSGQGFVKLDQFLPEAEFLAVKDELRRAALPVLEMGQPPALTRRMNLDAKSCRGSYPALYRLITSEMLLRLLRHASGYPGSPIIAIQCIHSSVSEARDMTRNTDWHVDTFHQHVQGVAFPARCRRGRRSLPYASGRTTGTSEHGPCERWRARAKPGAASHVNRLHAKGSFRVTEAELKTMGYGEPFIGAVKANTLIVADTGGISPPHAQPAGHGQGGGLSEPAAKPVFRGGSTPA